MRDPRSLTRLNMEKAINAAIATPPTVAPIIMNVVVLEIPVLPPLGALSDVVGVEEAVGVEDDSVDEGDAVVGDADIVLDEGGNDEEEVSNCGGKDDDSDKDEKVAEAEMLEGGSVLAGVASDDTVEGRADVVGEGSCEDRESEVAAKAGSLAVGEMSAEAVGTAFEVTAALLAV